jgi:hypothetical protein
VDRLAGRRGRFSPNLDCDECLHAVGGAGAWLGISFVPGRDVRWMHLLGVALAAQPETQIRRPEMPAEFESSPALLSFPSAIAVGDGTRDRLATLRFADRT